MDIDLSNLAERTKIRTDEKSPQLKSILYVMTSCYLSGG
jgi:hypothetical protein